MNRALLLCLTVLTLNLFGKAISPERLETGTPIFSLNSPSNLTSKPFAQPILMDTVSPVINCPASELILITTQGACDTVLNYSVTATDDQGQAIVIQLSGLASGSAFPMGVSTCVFLATDLAGNTATCSFSYTVEDGGVPTLDCKDLVTVALDANCLRPLLPGEVLEGGPYGCWNRYFTEVDRTMPFGNGPWGPATFNANDINKTYQCRVTDNETGNKCWGNVKILDTLPPVFNCQHLVVSCSEDNLSPNFLKDSLGLTAAMPQVSDACGMITFLGHIDDTDLLNCDSPFTKVTNRMWQANDEYGNTSTCLQRIQMHRHSIDEVQIPADITLNCLDANVDPAVTGSPFVMYQGRKYEMENNSICDISAFYTDYPLPLACGDVRVRRLWELFDFCTGETQNLLLQNIYIRDETSPTVACPASLFITVDADTCRGVVDLPDAVLNDACSQMASFQAFWDEDGLSKTLLGSMADFSGNDPNSFDTLGVMGTAVFPVGTTTISYVAEDSCGNIGDCTFNLTVADMVPPVANCDTFSSLQLLEDGTLAIGASALDNASSDACTPIAFKARFLEISACLFDTLWTDTLRFCCLNQDDTLDAVLRVYDIPVPNGTVSNTFGSGHFSDCALKIAITDTNPPVCVAPQNLTVDCEAFDPTLESYGIIVSTSCIVDSMAIEVDYTLFDTVCNRGTVTRIFKVFDAAGNVGGCAQAVTVDYVQDYYTKFPDDVIVSDCDSTGIYGEPLFFGQNCEDFKVEFTDEVFTVVPDACFKIERTWKITNNCTYNDTLPLIVIPNPNPVATPNHPSNLPGPIVSACTTLGPWAASSVKINPTDPLPTLYCNFWEANANGYQYTQIIKVIDGTAPTGTYAVPTCSNQNWITTNNAQFWHETYWTDPNIGGNDMCEEPTELSIVGTDACSGSNVNIEYLLFLDLDGDNITETVVNSVHVGAGGLGWNNVRFNNLNTPNFVGGTNRAFDERPVAANQKVGFAIEETVSGNNKTARVRWNTEQQPNVYFPPELPHGNHKIKWFITDGCGNNKEIEYSFSIRDCKAPTAVCLGPLSVNVLPAGFTVMHASDFLQYTEDNCTPDSLIDIAIRKCGSGTGFPVDGNGNPSQSVTFNCTEIGTHCVEIWAKDKAGNADFCEGTLNVQDNLGVCPGTNDSIIGRIITEQGVGIADVSISIEGTSNFAPPFSYFYPNLTDSLGYYYLGNQYPIDATFDIRPDRDDNPLNGVTTYDLVLISKHIVATEPLNSPYKMIAADANKSGSVTSFDIVEIRKLILGIYMELPNNTSWRFVDSSFVFPNPLNPFQTGFPDTIPFSNQAPNNFIGIKVGDVNNTAVPNLQSPAEERFDGTVYFDTEHRDVRAGDVFELKFSASEPLEGCQFTLETAGLEILEILPGEGMGKDNFALFPQKSRLTMAWETGGQASFTLKVKAQKAGSIRQMLRISDEITRAEGYKMAVSSIRSIAKQRIELRFGNPTSSFELFQNQPNPFEDKTAITFQLPEASTAELSVMDATGKVLWTQSSDWPAGLSTVEINLSRLSAAGVLYYKLQTPTGSAVRKMIRI